jgi:hypothetical protein
MQAAYRYIATGDAYGRGRRLVNAHAPKIEIYDAAHAGKPGFEPEGQIVASYYVSTLREGADRAMARGLVLHDDVPAWTLSPAQVADMLAVVEAAERPA